MMKAKIKVLIPVLSATILLGILTALLCVLLSPKTPFSSNKFEVQSVEIVKDGNCLSSFDAQVYDQNVAFAVKINDGADLSSFESPNVKWSFEGQSLAATVSNDGIVDFGDTLGEVVLLAEVESKNRMVARLPICINARDGTSVQSIAAFTKDGFSQSYIEGQYFNKDSISVWGSFGSYEAKISTFEVGKTPFEEEQTPLTETCTEIFVFYENKTFELPISVNRKSLQSIEIVSSPDKLVYVEGQKFDKTGLKIKANYEYLDELVDDFVVDEDTPLRTENESVVISYSFNNITKTAMQPIEVEKRKLLSIDVDDQNVLRSYIQGDTFDPTGIVVTANFEEVGFCQVTDFDFDQAVLTSDTTTIAISYTENGITATRDVEILVEKPYEHKREVSLSNAGDVNLSWIFSYVDDEGIRKIDDTAFLEHDLVCDQANGEFEIPVGAVLNLRSLNAGILDFEIDGVRQNTQYPNNILSFKVTKGEKIVISAVMISENRKLIHFAGDGKEINFSYGEKRTGPLDENHYNQVGMIFKDADAYYFQFKIGDQTYNYQQLKSVEFNESCEVVVTKILTASTKKELTFCLYDEYQETIQIEKDTRLEDIETPQRTGYAFVGWAMTADGVKLNEEKFGEYLSEERETYKLYALWTLEDIDYSESELVGTWSVALEDQTQDGQSVTCNASYTFEANGTFSYLSNFNDQTTLTLFGFYRIENDLISVINVRCEDATVSISGGDFAFTLDQSLLANLFLIDDQLVCIEGITFEK